jgi:DNA-binding response OmpR family regulator
MQTYDADVLVVDDDNAVVEVVTALLADVGYGTATAPDGLVALHTLERSHFDLAIVDVKLPNMSGLDLVREMRSRHWQVPVLMLSGLGEVSDRVSGLDVGADDYLLKPFDPNELISRVRALLRRSQPPTAPITVDADARTLTYGGVSVSLSLREFALASRLVVRSNQITSRRELLNSVWGSDVSVLNNSLDVYIGYLRRKFRDSTIALDLESVRGLGYRLVLLDAPTSS